MTPERKIVNPQDFHKKGPSLNRVWDHVNQRGIGISQVNGSAIDFQDLEYIFVREDGWSIAATAQGYHSAYDLWPNEWETIIQKGE